MNKIKAIIIVITFSVVTLTCLTRSKALTLNPQIGEKINSITVEINSGYSGTATGVRLRLTAKNAIFTSFKSTNTANLLIGTCEGQKTFEADKICVDLVNPAGIKSGEKIGEITMDITGESLVTATVENAYIGEDAQTMIKASGVIGQYSTTSIVRKADIGVSYQEEETVKLFQNPQTGTTVKEPVSKIYIGFIVISIIIMGSSAAALVYILKKKR
ncbi:MAG: hypothetical protein WCJ58_06570 [bacterium]